MKTQFKILKSIIAIYIFSVHISFAQDLLWKSNFTGTGDNIPAKSAIDGNNNIYTIGSFTNTCNLPITLTTKGSTDAFLTKIDANGNIVWTRQIGGTLIDVPWGVVVSPDNQFIYVTGVFQGTAFAETKSIVSSGGFDGFLAKYTQNGDLVWFKNIASASVTGLQRPTEIKIDKNQQIVISGIFGTELKIGTTIKDSTLYTTQAEGMFIAQLDTSGALLKAKRFESSNNTSYLYTFDVDTSGYYLTGFFKGNLITDLGTYASNSGSFDMFVYKMGYDLSSKWIIKAAGINDDQIYSCSVDNKGFFYIGGHFRSSTLSVDSTGSGILSLKTAVNKGSNTYDIFFAKYRYDGQLQWFNSTGSTGEDRLYRALYKNGNFIAAGQYNGTMTFNNKTITPRTAPDAFAIVQNQNDNLVYLMNIGGVGVEIGETAVVDNIGNFVVIGDYASSRLYFDTQDSIDNSENGTKDMFIAKYDKGSLLKTITPITCYGSATGAVSLTPEGTVVAPYTFSWTKVGDPAFTRNTKDINGLSAGTYKVTFTDALGYTKSDSATLTNPTAVDVTLDSTKNVLCYNGSNGKLYVTPSGGTGTYTYAWSAISGSGVMATQQDQLALSAGTYKIVVKDQNNCADSLENIPVAQPAKINFGGSFTTNINPPSVLGAVNLSVAGGTPAYGYLWSGPSSFSASTEDISNLTNSGNYNVTVTDANNCAGDTSFIITDPNQMTAGIQSKQDVRCRGELNGSVTISVQNALGSPTFAWSNGGNTASLSNLPAGNYTVTVTDSRPSSVIVNVAINEPSAVLTVSIARTNISCSGMSDGLLDANPNGGTLPYNYTWTKETVPYGGNTETLTDLTEGSYAVTVTDANNCTANNIQSIINPSPITYTGTPTPVTCEGGKNDGAITLSNIQGGTGAYSFLWSNGFTTQNISLLPAGNYSVTVTDGNNCTKPNNYVVGYSSPMTVTITATQITCNGANNGILDANVTGGHGGETFLWSNNATTDIINGLAPNSYTVTVTDNKSCTKTQTANITQPTALTINTVLQNNVSCYGRSDGSVTVSASGGTPNYTYQWDNGAGNTSTASSLPAATYHVTVTDNNSCTANRTYIVSEPDPMGLSENTGLHFNPLCNGQTTGSISLTATGGHGIYQYSMNNGPWTDTCLFTGLSAGNYTFSVRDKSVVTCNYSMTTPISIVEPPVLGIGGKSKTNITCFGLTDGKLSALGSGGSGTLTYTLKLAGIATGNNSGATTGSFTGIPAGVGYTIEVTDTNFCGPVVSSLDSIIEPPAIIISPISKTNISCYGLNDGKLSALGSGGSGTLTYTLKLAGLATGNNSGSISGSFTGIPAGVGYTIEVTDTNSCGPIISSSDSIIEPPALIISPISKTNITCYGLNDGKLSALGSGGSGPLTYTLKLSGITTGNNSGATTGSFTGISAGVGYTIEVSDTNFCGPVISTLDSLIEPTAINIGPISKTDITCNGLTNGILSAVGSGGVGTLIYSLKQNNILTGNITGDSTGIYTGLPAGTGYTIEVTDSNNCGPVISSIDSINEPLTLSISPVSKTNISCFGLNNGRLSAIGSGGSGILSYTLKLNGVATTNNSGDTTGIYTGLTAGTGYTIEVTDTNYCDPAISTMDSIIEPPLLYIDTFSTVNVTCNGQANGSINISSKGGTGTNLYSLKLGGVNTGNTSGDSTGVYTGLLAGLDYTISVTDSNNCIINTPLIAITQPEALRIVTDTAIKATQKIPEWNGRIEVLAGGGTQPYTYTLDTAVNKTGIFTTLKPGKYQVSITDSNSCGPLRTDSLLVEDAISVPVINNGKLTFFPNPARNFINIKFELQIIKEFTLEFVSLNGAVVYRETITSDIIQQGIYQINLKNITRGVYLVRINGKTAREKIVVQ